MKNVIVTGAPRSGSRRLQAAFGQAKVEAAHERDSAITISCFLAVDADTFFLNARHAPYWDREVDEIWHQVRNPLDCIASVAVNIRAPFWVWQAQFTGVHPRNFRTRRECAAHFWVRWNREVEERGPVYRFRIEDLEHEWPVMWERLGLGAAPPLDARGEQYSGRDRDLAQAKKKEPLTWEELLSWGPTIHDGVRELAERYGYDVP